MQRTLTPLNPPKVYESVSLKELGILVEGRLGHLPKLSHKSAPRCHSRHVDNNTTWRVAGRTRLCFPCVLGISGTSSSHLNSCCADKAAEANSDRHSRECKEQPRAAVSTGEGFVLGFSGVQSVSLHLALTVLSSGTDPHWGCWLILSSFLPPPSSHSLLRTLTWTFGQRTQGKEHTETYWENPHPLCFPTRALHLQPPLHSSSKQQVSSALATGTIPAVLCME